MAGESRCMKYCSLKGIRCVVQCHSLHALYLKRKKQLFPGFTKLCGLCLAFFHTCCLALQNGYKSHGDPQWSTATLKPSWWWFSSVFHLVLLPLRYWSFIWLGKLLSSVWWGSKNAGELNEFLSQKVKIPPCCLTHNCSVMLSMT